MTRTLTIHRAGPGLTVQDLGRPGYLSLGLSRGGAADRLAMAEGAALLGQPPDHAAVEMAGIGGVFSADADTRIALTGAPMPATIDGERIAWNAVHLLPKGAQLSIGAAQAGVYGYLHLGGGVIPPVVLGARATHLAAGIGAALGAGDSLPIGDDPRSADIGLLLEPSPRMGGGTIRVVPSLQTDLFSADQIALFEQTPFRRDARGNRMGMRLESDTKGFHSDAGLSVLSEVIVPGDIQITGDGTPFVLLCECQTTGGYPRIGSVLPCDLPRVAQTRPGEVLRFVFVTLEEGIAAERRAHVSTKSLRGALRPLVRDPHSIRDLLSYQLISGVTDGTDPGDDRAL